jgi:hypothetical protein
MVLMMIMMVTTVACTCDACMILETALLAGNIVIITAVLGHLAKEGRVYLVSLSFFSKYLYIPLVTGGTANHKGECGRVG